MSRLSIHGFEVYTAPADTKSQSDGFQVIQFSVGNADTASDTSTTESFSFDKYFYQGFLINPRGFDKRGDKFFQNAFFVFCL